MDEVLYSGGCSPSLSRQPEEIAIGLCGFVSHALSSWLQTGGGLALVQRHWLKKCQAVASLLK